jgi:hypothetical protein
MPNNYVLLERIELNASAASVTFANIPQTGYTDLKIEISTRTDRTGTVADNTTMKINSSTSGYSARLLEGNGSSALSFVDSNQPPPYTFNAAAVSATANTFSNVSIYIPNYAGSTNKSYSVDSVQETNATTAYARLSAALLSNTAAISSLTFYNDGGANFVSGSTFSLYGLAALGTTPAIAPKATGGNVIATDGTYWYHAFRTNGTFTPQVGLTADVLVVAGGGGGGSSGSGGGGAGGLFAFTSQSLTTTNYTCTVGAGGALGVTGIDSQFGSLTLVKGGGRGGNPTTRPGGDGGSGGGAQGGFGIFAGGVATSGQGFDGGAATSTLAGSGGGAGAIGATGGAGGIGSSAYSSWGSATSTGQLSGGTYYYAGGGGGGGNVGGLGGGGQNTTPGTANTGGGGGGANGSSAGGSGIIIVRYTIA